MGGTHFYVFGPFRLETSGHLLLNGSEILPLTPKALSTLLLLIENRGKTVSKSELMEKIWPDTFVEESSLARNISVLRRALDDTPERGRYIVTLAKRGYRFVGSVTETVSDYRFLEGGLPVEQSVLPAEWNGCDVQDRATTPWATEARKPELLVGRERELAMLEGSLTQTLNGSGRVVFITGEAGIGKTSLSDEFGRRIRSLHPACIFSRGRCLEQYGTGEAYLPFLAAVSGLLSGPHKKDVVAMLRKHAPTWCLQFPAVFGANRFLEELRLETIGATKERMTREIGDALCALSGISPVVLLLEDLHDADPSSIDLLRHLCQRVKSLRLLVLSTFRPEQMETSDNPLKSYKHEIQAHRECEEIALGPLSEENIQTYLDKYFIPNSFGGELAAVLHKKTEGHPLFAISLMQYLEVRGYLARQNDCWTLACSLSEIAYAVPENVRSVIRGQIENLDEESRNTLQYASIEGEEFCSLVLARLLELDELAIDERLNRLESVNGLIQNLGEEEIPDGTLRTRYRFAHVLYQNVLYESLAPKRRMLLHRLAGEELLSRYAGHTSLVAAQLATHFERCRDHSRAAEYLLKAGDNASGLYDNAVAINHYRRALALVDKLPAAEQPVRLSILYQKLAGAHLGLGQLAEAENNLTALLGYARSRQDTFAQCVALNALANYHHYSRRVSDLGLCATQAMELAEQLNNEPLRSEALANVALVHQVSGQLDKAKDYFARAIQSARTQGHMPALLPALTYGGVRHFFQTEYEEAEALELQAVSLASKAHDGFYLANSLFYLGLSLANQGRLSESLATLHNALDMARRNGNKITLSRIPNSLGWVYRELFETVRGIEHDRMGVEIAREAGRAEAEANSLLNLVQGFTYVNEPGLALAALRDVEPLTEREEWIRWRFYGIRFHAAAAEFWLSLGKLDEAHKHASQLLENALCHGVPKYVATAKKILAEVSLAAGDRNVAVKELRSALFALGNRHAPLIAWRIYSVLGCALKESGDVEGMQEARAQSSRIIHAIASNISDDSLRQTFLQAPAVREASGVRISCKSPKKGAGSERE